MATHLLSGVAVGECMKALECHVRRDGEVGQSACKRLADRCPTLA